MIGFVLFCTVMFLIIGTVGEYIDRGNADEAASRREDAAHKYRHMMKKEEEPKGRYVTKYVRSTIPGVNGGADQSILKAVQVFEPFDTGAKEMVFNSTEVDSVEEKNDDYDIEAEYEESVNINEEDIIEDVSVAEIEKDENYGIIPSSFGSVVTKDKYVTPVFQSLMSVGSKVVKHNVTFFNEASEGIIRKFNNSVSFADSVVIDEDNTDGENNDIDSSYNANGNVVSDVINNLIEKSAVRSRIFSDVSEELYDRMSRVEIVANLHKDYLGSNDSLADKLFQFHDVVSSLFRYLLDTDNKVALYKYDVMYQDIARKVAGVVGKEYYIKIAFDKDRWSNSSERMSNVSNMLDVIIDDANKSTIKVNNFISKEYEDDITYLTQKIAEVEEVFVAVSDSDKNSTKKSV